MNSMRLNLSPASLQTALPFLSVFQYPHTRPKGYCLLISLNQIQACAPDHELQHPRGNCPWNHTLTRVQKV
ncbi:hypothetical protein HanPSC8_Chr06g0244371 [Helianthus annuus]|nr:hypothetical protein HanPSC8_Chr06g0244371 [Helianthus annuus]